MQPEKLKRGKRFHEIVQNDFIDNSNDGDVKTESFIPFQGYEKVNKNHGFIDVFIDLEGDSIAIYEIKATDWDKINFKNIKRNIYRHQKQLFDYIYRYYDIDKQYASFGIIYPAPPGETGLREYIHKISEDDYCVPVYWYTELNENFSLSMLDIDI